MKTIIVIVMLFIISLSVHARESNNGTQYREAGSTQMANPNNFEECAAVTGWLMKGRDTDIISEKKTVKIPHGWTVIGTGMRGKTPIFFMCR